jgi:hypothetical protein
MPFNGGIMAAKQWQSYHEWMCGTNDLKNDCFLMTNDVHRDGNRLFGDEYSRGGSSIGQEDWNGGHEGARFAS